MKLYQASSFKIYVFESFGFNITHLSSSMTQSISQSKISCFKIMVLRVSLWQLVSIIIVSILNPIVGRSSRKPPDPLSTRTTNKELNVKSFMTEMMQWSSIKLRVLGFMFREFWWSRFYIAQPWRAIVSSSVFRMSAVESYRLEFCF